MHTSNDSTTTASPEAGPSREQVRRWRRYLADEIAEGQVYRQIALSTTVEI
ncbi:MAG: hypothetical protein QJR09_10200 [Micrococcus sp.]|nr:hypothetical protein [Micrococcus sp.]